MAQIKKALISVTNKDMIADFAVELNKLGIEIYSTRGTSAYLKNLGINAVEIEKYTGFPEILDGRVKTLHPKIFGGILAKRELKTHQDELAQHKITTFDLVCVDLYHVTKYISEGADTDAVMEHTDIGGISLIRSAAKAFKDVTILTDPNDFKTVLNEIKKTGGTSLETRKKLAAKAFNHSSDYDNAISNYLAGAQASTRDINSGGHGISLRYGENPHQTAKFFGEKTYIKDILKGEISYNNILDLEGSADLCFGLKAMGYKYVAVIVKHGSPCGVGISEKNISDAFTRAWDCDPLSSYGGVLVINSQADSELLAAMKGKFVEVLAVGSYSKDFIEGSAERKKLKMLSINEAEILFTRNMQRTACGGTLEQSRDVWWDDFKDAEKNFSHVSKRKYNSDEFAAMKFCWAVTAITKSNAIIIGTKDRILGIGGGSVSRIDATNMAIEKAHAQIKTLGGKVDEPIIMSSDGFFPFADSIHMAKQLGITAIIEPGGSMRDEEVLSACNENNIAVVFTGKRHFRH
ncbi:MAG: bifunctional phosphoribosylaminoimidazolecarboxamide formyltransferase/IMP cyclohydrolase [Pseudomonadota bacterium]